MHISGRLVEFQEKTGSRGHGRRCLGTARRAAITVAFIDIVHLSTGLLYCDFSWSVLETSLITFPSTPYSFLSFPLHLMLD